MIRYGNKLLRLSAGHWFGRQLGQHTWRSFRSQRAAAAWVVA